MAEEQTRHSHNSHSYERKIERGEDGFIEGDRTGDGEKIGTHTPGNHLRSETVREGQAAGEAPQSHENREHSEKDHVPGHMGYTRENIVGVNPTSAPKQ